jgi:Secretion system C-terminal sorting domain
MLKTSFLLSQGGYVINDKVTIVKNSIVVDYPMFNNGSANNFGSQNFGTFTPSLGNTLVMKTPYFESTNPCEINSASLGYRIYSVGTTPPAFTEISLTINATTGVNSPYLTYTCVNTSSSINVLASAPSVGNYQIDIRFRYSIIKSGFLCDQDYFSNIYTANFSVTGSALPVEISTIKAYKQSNRGISIVWKTENEKDSKSFHIERSSDGLIFSNIGNLMGAINSAVEKIYNFTDNTPLQGINYYRLKSIDIHGKETISNILSVIFSEKMNNKLQIYPNPAFSALQITIFSDEESIKSVQVLDFEGRIILAKNTVLAKGLNNLSLDINTLSSGTYLVKMGGEVSRFLKM